MSEKTSSHKIKQSSSNDEQKIKKFLVKGEILLYHAQDIFFTNKRIIKMSTSFLATTFSYFYTTFEDLEFKSLESIKAKNIINIKLFLIGVGVLMLGPIATLLSLIPYIGEPIGDFFFGLIVDPLGFGGLFLVSLVFLISSLILRDRYIEFHGSNTVLISRHFDDDELVKIRNLQQLGLKP